MSLVFPQLFDELLCSLIKTFMLFVDFDHPLTSSTVKNLVSQSLFSSQRLVVSQTVHISIYIIAVVNYPIPLAPSLAPCWECAIHHHFLRTMGSTYFPGKTTQHQIITRQMLSL